AEREEVDGGAADDLVRTQMDREERIAEREEAARRDRDQQPEHPAARDVRAPDPEEGAGEHHSLEPDVHDAAALRVEPAERCVSQNASRPSAMPAGPTRFALNSPSPLPAGAGAAGSTARARARPRRRTARRSPG